MASWLSRFLTATGLWLAASAGPAVAADPIVIVSDTVYREGVFLVVDATVANRPGTPIEQDRGLRGVPRLLRYPRAGKATRWCGP